MAGRKACKGWLASTEHASLHQGSEPLQNKNFLFEHCCRACVSQICRGTAAEHAFPSRPSALIQSMRFPSELLRLSCLPPKHTPALVGLASGSFTAVGQMPPHTQKNEHALRTLIVPQTAPQRPFPRWFKKLFGVHAPVSFISSVASKLRPSGKN